MCIAWSPPQKKKGNLMTLIAPTHDPIYVHPKHSVRTGECNWIAWQSIEQKISKISIIRKKPGPSQDKQKVSTTTTLNTFEPSIILFFCWCNLKKNGQGQVFDNSWCSLWSKSPSLSLKGRDSPNSPLHGVPGASSKPGRRWPTPTVSRPGKEYKHTKIKLVEPYTRSESL